METLSPAASSSHKQHLALRVALDTMKDRCILQQKRITELEEECQQLREMLTQQNPNSTISHSTGGLTENIQLQLQLSELKRQKTQLNAHFDMVSAENRKLWSRLSQIAKDQTVANKDNDYTLNTAQSDAGGGDASPRGSVSTALNQNLIRSKTFTQHFPNPNLRHKVISTECSVETPTMRDVSLDNDVAIEAYNEGGTKSSSDLVVDQATMAFGFLNEDDSSVTTQEQVLGREMKMCIDNMHNMRSMALRQRKDLNTLLSTMKNTVAHQPCPDCVNKSEKPEMADKSLETDESFNESKYTNQLQNGLSHLSETCINTSNETVLAETNHLSITQERLMTDESNKICPMCGKIYDCGVTFDMFCEHVEDHFRGDIINLDQSIEDNFEYIEHAVGNF